jgi:hypothetical protein
MTRTIVLTRRRALFAVAAIGVFTTLVAGTTAFGVARSFSDVPPDHEFYEEITWAEEHEIVNGFLDGTFRPANNVTRQAVVAFLARYNDTVHLIETNTDPGASASFILDAECGAGERAIAGGGAINADDVYMADSFPLVVEGDWRVRWETENDAVINPPSMTVYALCAPRQVS